MFAGINVCGYFMSCQLSRYIIMFAGYLFLRFKDRREIRQINPSETLMNLQYSKRMELGIVRQGDISYLFLNYAISTSE